MINQIYRQQVQLLLQVLSQVAKETAFALKGGTAINLFIRNLPRLSVDIDLTYLPVVDRDTDLQAISEALNRIKRGLESLSPRIEGQLITPENGIPSKLLCKQGTVQIKVEVNTTIRGHLQPVREMLVLDKVQEEFGLFSANQVVSLAELYGGKLCAALDRQHPRDLFDVAILLENEGITNNIKLGFIVALLSHGRPIHELLRPTFKNTRDTFERQFAGMAYKPFSYDDYEITRQHLVKELHQTLNDHDRQFLMAFKAGSPDWTLFPWREIETLPAIQWKLKNLKKLIDSKPEKHAKQLGALERSLV